MLFWNTKHLLQQLNQLLKKNKTHIQIVEMWNNTDLPFHLYHILQHANQMEHRAVAQSYLYEWLAKQSAVSPEQGLQEPWSTLWKMLFPLLQPTTPEPYTPFPYAPPKTPAHIPT
ncbi:MAG: hypothetical protein AAGJ35_13445, partial [Myxococcota bacterium]